MFVIILRYSDPDATAKVRPAHEEWVYAHVASGHFMLTGPMVPRVGGIIIADVPSRAELDAMIDQDPYSKAGTSYEVHEFNALAGCLREAASLLRTAG